MSAQVVSPPSQVVAPTTAANCHECANRFRAEKTTAATIQPRMASFTPCAASRNVN